MKPLLKVENLITSFDTDDGKVIAVDGVSFAVNSGETVAIVGESGCGKSVTSLSILQLIPTPPGKIEEGKIIFEDQDLLKLSKSEMRKIRGKDIAMIFQEPMTSLNPVFTCGDQMMEAILEHQDVNRKKAKEIVLDMLEMVGIPLPAQRFDEYPHQMSGGMRQRIMIGMALCCNPKLLVADEPTTALDVTIQAQILDLLIKLREKLGMSILLITHDLGVVAEMADRVIVVYAGKVIEEAPVMSLFKNPSHPYTRGLLDSIPKLNIQEDQLSTIEGNVPSLNNMPSGCRFHPRCNFANDKCKAESPKLRQSGDKHSIACHLNLDEIKKLEAEIA